MNPLFDEKNKRRMFGLISTLLIVLILFVVALAINTFKENAYIGQPVQTSPNTISVTGTGDVLAIPDTATFSFSVVADAKTVTDAQSQAADKTNAIIAAIKALGVADADIQTTDYSSYPTYSYSRVACPLNQIDASGGNAPTSQIYYPPCTNQNQTLTGYEVTESISVKVRKTDDAGAVLTKVGTLGATNISSLNFVVDNPDTVQAQARDKAIADAQAKASVLAKSLGVKLTKIISFSENGYQPPVYYSMNTSGMAAGSTASTVPTVQPGTNKITSTVTIMYEID